MSKKLITVKEYISNNNPGPLVLDNSAMCANKWTYLYVNLHGGVVKCCYNVPDRVITKQELQELGTNVFFNSDYEKERRQEKLNNIRHTDCNDCWECEKRGVTSNRLPENFYNIHKARFNAERGLTPLPTFLEIHFSNVCDLKCIYCGPQFSTQWESELKKFNIPVEISKDQTDNLLEKELYKWLELEGFKNIISYHIQGGEPLIQNEFYKFLEYLKTNKLNQYNIKPEIIITTNANASKKYFKKFLSLLDSLHEKVSFRIDVSIESVEKRAEFIRSNLSWKTFEDNVTNLLKFSKNKDITVRFSCTHNSLSLPTFINFLKWANSFQQMFDIEIPIAKNTVVQPDWLAIWTLDSNFKDNIDECIEYIKNEAPNWTEYSKFLESLKFGLGKSSPKVLKQIPYNIEQLENRRGFNFLETFPELEIWFNSHKEN